MNSAVRLEVIDGVGHVTLCQPERGNPFDDVFCRELRDVANACSEDARVRAILIKAEGKFFSVGADLKWLGKDRATMPALLKGATADLHMAIARFVRADAPVVIAVHALATGGSVALTAMADFAIAARSAKFYAAYNRIGYASDGSGSYFLPRRVGSRRAAEFLMLNQTWDAATAMEYGLLTAVVDDDAVHREAGQLAAQLAAGPTRTYAEMKRLLLSSADQPLETQLEFEAQAIARCAKTEDSWNAIQSLLARQEPIYRGV